MFGDSFSSPRLDNPVDGFNSKPIHHSGGASVVDAFLIHHLISQARYDGGSLTTGPLEFTTDRLTVNVKADFGRVFVELLDKKIRLFLAIRNQRPSRSGTTASREPSDGRERIRSRRSKEGP